LIQQVCGQGEGDLLRNISTHLERPLIREVLRHTRWNQVRASAVLGINRNTLRAKMRSLGLKKPLNRMAGNQDLT